MVASTVDVDTSSSSHSLYFRTLLQVKLSRNRLCSIKTTILYQIARSIQKLGKIHKFFTKPGNHTKLVTCSSDYQNLPIYIYISSYYHISNAWSVESRELK